MQRVQSNQPKQYPPPDWHIITSALPSHPGSLNIKGTADLIMKMVGLMFHERWNIHSQLPLSLSPSLPPPSNPPSNPGCYLLPMLHRMKKGVRQGRGVGPPFISPPAPRVCVSAPIRIQAAFIIQSACGNIYCAGSAMRDLAAASEETNKQPRLRSPAVPTAASSHSYSSSSPSSSSSSSLGFSDAFPHPRISRKNPINIR